jgi:FMN-dependent NADH-azoreductase
MQRILYVTSSLFGDQSASKQLSDEFVRRLKTRHPHSVVTVLDRSRLQSGQDVQVYRARTTGAGRKHASVPASSHAAAGIAAQTLDTQTGHLKSVLGLMGITDVETDYA